MNKAIVILAAGRVLFEKIRSDKVLRTAAILFLAMLLFIAYTAVIVGAADRRAQAIFESWKLEWIADQEAAVESDPYTIQLNEESDMLARVLYGVKDNSTNDLRTYCWCVLNRVDNKAYPATLAEVIAQPQQWMGYSPDNPVLENLYQIARDQLDRWHSQRRPVSNEFVYMNWTEKEIVLRDSFRYDSTTHYWRYE